MNRISQNTAKAISPMVRAIAESGVLPKEEAIAVENILRAASRAQTKSKKEKEKLINAEEVSLRLGVCRKTVLRMRQAGQLKGILVTGSNKSLKFSEREIENLISNEEANDE